MDYEDLQLDFNDLDSLGTQIPQMSESDLLNALRDAVSSDNGAAANLLAQAIRPGHRGPEALVNAIQRGFVHIVRQLVNLYGSTEDYSYPLEVAAWVGIPEIVEVLLQTGIPTPAVLNALRRAALSDNNSALELMARHINVDTVILDELRQIQLAHDESFKVVDKLVTLANPITRVKVAEALLRLYRMPGLAQYCSGQTKQEP